MNQKIAKQDIISRYHIRAASEMPEQFQQLLQKLPSIFKISSHQPTQTRGVHGYNQEILVYSSNSTTPLKTAGIQQQDQFQFDEKIFTPQPSGSAFDWNQQIRREPIFSYSQAGRYNNLDKRMWFYVDDFQKVQGPFNSIQMDSWYIRGIFEDIMRIGNKKDDQEFSNRLYQLKGFKPHKQEARILKKILIRRKSCPPIISKTMDAQIKLPPIDDVVVKVLQLPIRNIKNKKK